MPDQESAGVTESAAGGATRRGMLRGAAGIGAAGIAASVFAGASAGVADASPRAAKAEDGPVEAKTITVHLADASTGMLDVFSGTSHVRIRDAAIAARLAQAAG